MSAIEATSYGNLQSEIRKRAFQLIGVQIVAAGAITSLIAPKLISGLQNFAAEHMSLDVTAESIVHPGAAGLVLVAVAAAGLSAVTFFAVSIIASMNYFSRETLISSLDEDGHIRLKHRIDTDDFKLMRYHLVGSRITYKPSGFISFVVSAFIILFVLG